MQPNLDKVTNARCLQSPQDTSQNKTAPQGQKRFPAGSWWGGSAVLGLVTVQGLWGGVFLSRFCSSHITK